MEEVTLSRDGQTLPTNINTEPLLNAESFEYGEVEIPDEETGDDDISEDFDLAMQRLLQSNIAALKTPEPDPCISRHPEVVDDYIRNFLIKMGMSKTLDLFETEWYDLKSAGKLQAVATDRVPDAYMHNAKLSDEIISLKKQLAKANSIAAKASSTWDTFRKERDFHRMHHKRVVQEKNKLIKDIKRMKDHYEQYEPTITALKRKYEAATREKSLMGIERDRLRQSLKQLHAAGHDEHQDTDTIKAARGPPATTGPKAPLMEKALAATLPVGPRQNPFASLKFEALTWQGMRVQKTFKGHSLGVAHVVLHPRKPVLATASDDATWRLWHLPDGDLIMSGEGHKDWVAALDFHPSGACIASGGADCVVKVWDFAKQRCSATLRDHTAAVWAVAFHDAGEMLASCSLDSTIRVWDVAAAKSTMALRGHVDSVNEVHWLMCTNTLASASSDKTLSLWDGRTGLPSATLFGHGTSINSVSSNLAGTVLASADADGVVKIWDIRMLRETSSIALSAHALNRVRFDRSGEVAVVACDDGHVYSVDVAKGDPLADLTGHEDSVNSIALDPSGEFLISASSDCSFILWSS